MNNRVYSCIAIILVCTMYLYAIDNPHFYRSTNFIHAEPKIEHDLFSSLDISLAGGSSCTSRNSNHQHVPLFDLYGTQSVPALFKNDNHSDDVCANIVQKLPPSFLLPPQGHVSFDATFKITEANISYSYIIKKGMLLLFHIPIRRLEIKNVSYTDITPISMINEEWQHLFNIFPQCLSHSHITIAPWKGVGIGDLTTLIGFTHNYQHTKVLDFIDGTVALGILFPTGKTKNPRDIFSLPLGYNGHFGIPLQGSLAIGTYGWVTIGTYIQALFFMHKNQNLGLKTDLMESGPIRSTFSSIRTSKGADWNTGIYFKADHFAYGLSFTTAYSFSGEQKTHLSIPYNSPFDSAIINSDSSLQGWNMHTLHFSAEYDFATHDSQSGLRVGAFYTLQLQGTRVFETNMLGGTFGLDIAWTM